MLKKSGTTWIQDAPATIEAREQLVQAPPVPAVALVDCNGNAISDSVDIPNPLAGDLNGDTHTNAEDLGMLLARWGLVP